MKAFASILLILMFGIGCSPTLHPWKQYNRTQRDWMTDFWNDTAKIQVQWYGDYRFDEAPRKDRLSQHIRIYSDLFMKSLRVKVKDLLLVGETIVDYRFYASIAFIDSEKLSARKLAELGFSPDSNGNFSKTLVSENPKYAAVVKLYTQSPNWIAILAFTLDEDLIDANSWYVKSFCFENVFSAKIFALKTEFYGQTSDDGIFNSVRYGKDYQGFRSINPFTWGLELFESTTNGNYYLPVDQLLTVENNYESMVDKDMFYQALLTYNSFLHDDSLQTVYLRKKNLANASKSIKGDHISDLESVKEHIVDSARNSRVVMFNESHYAPQHRYLVSACLEDLYDAGYRYLALECLHEADDSLAARGFPVIKSGIYSREPQMANLIRNALRIGYKLISYESMESDREKMQATNIINKSFAVDSSARVVVLGGWSHTDENPTKGWMAYYFKSMTRIDPLTVNQTDMYPFFEAPNSKVALVPDYDMKRHDLPVLHHNDFYLINNLSLEDYRLFPSKNVRDVEYTLDLSKGLHGSCDFSVLLIYIKEEYSASGAIPVFTAKLRKGELNYHVTLPKGHYIPVIQSCMGTDILTEFCLP